MSRGRAFALAVLALVVLTSAIGVVYAKYLSRKLFVELDGLRDQRDALDVEWGQLQLEESTLGAHGRVERLAAERLGMRQPRPDEVFVLAPGKK
jgi:cell division protein FtsL